MYDIIVVGGGPAGLTAALYALRAEKKVLVIEGTGFGGQIIYTHEVDNFPGTAKMSGVKFADNLLEQVLSAGGEIEFEKVLSIKNSEVKTVVTDGGEYCTKAVVVATGVRYRRLGIEGEEGLIGSGISFCAVCDGAFYKGKTVAVIGGGNTAVEDAIYLSDIAKKIYLVHRRDEFRAEPRLVRMLTNRPNVELVLNHTVAKIDGKVGDLNVTLSHVHNGEEKAVSVNGVFVAIGQVPQNGIFDGLLTLDKNGYIVAGEECLTNVNGIFVAGDCRTKSVRQLTTAVGDGTVAAIAACNYIT